MALFTSYDSEEEFIAILKLDNQVINDYFLKYKRSELNVDNWNDNCEAKSEAKSPRPLRGLQVDFSLLRGQIII